MPDTKISPLPREHDHDILTREEAIAELRALVEEGLASGIDESSDMESIKQEALRRLAARRGG